MKQALERTQDKFESSCQRTPEYLAWHRLFKKEFKKFLNDKGITEIDISKPNHFDMSGFFKKDKCYYFSVSDLRWDKTFLLRTAEHFKDYTGGSNNFINMESLEVFEIGFNRIVG